MSRRGISNALASFRRRGEASMSNVMHSELRPAGLYMLLAILVGLLWGATNPFVRRGVLIADKRLPSFKPSGFAAIDAILCHITTPAYVVPQLLNLSGSLLFAYSLAQQGVSVSIFSPVANGASHCALLPQHSIQMNDEYNENAVSIEECEILAFSQEDLLPCLMVDDAPLRMGPVDIPMAMNGGGEETAVPDGATTPQQYDDGDNDNVMMMSTVTAADVDEDPLGALEAAIVQDRPHYKTSSEWKKMMASVAEEVNEPDREELTGTAEAKSQNDLGFIRGPRPSDKKGTPSAMQQAQAPLNNGRPAAIAEEEEEGYLAKQLHPPISLSELGEQGTKERRRVVFTTLQPICSTLLKARDNPEELSNLLSGLCVLLQEADPIGLQLCLDYLLFPLIMILDCSVATADRKRQAIPAAESKRVVLKTLACICAVTERCQCEREEQLVGLIQRLSEVVSAQGSSEDIKLMCFASIRHLLCHNKGLISSTSLFCSEENAPMIGHLITLCFMNSDSEPRVVRQAGLQALLKLLKVLSADAIAYFVPGIALGVSKVLRGHDSNSTMIVCALQSLAVLMASVLDAGHPRRDVGGVAQEEGEEEEEAAPGRRNVSMALERLSIMASFRNDKQSAEDRMMMMGGVASGDDGGGSEPPKTKSLRSGGKLRVDMTPAWRADTSSKLCQLLAAVFSPLTVHESVKVREALCRSCETVVSKVPGLSSELKELFMGVLLALSEDEWVEVASQAQQALSNIHSNAAVDNELIEQLTIELPQAFKRNDSAGRVVAKKLAAATKLMTPDLFASTVLQRSVRLDTILSSLTECFLPEPEAASLLVHSSPEMSTAYTLSSVSGSRKGNAIAVAVLPRMPLALAIVGSQDAYHGIASVARAIGLHAQASGHMSTLTDSCLSRLVHVVPCTGSRRLPQQQTANEVDDWQLKATALISLLTEFLTGAFTSSNNNCTSPELLIRCVVTVVTEITSEAIWSLSTSTAGVESPTHGLSLLSLPGSSIRKLGYNILLLRSALECIGSCASAMGNEFSKHGQLVRLVLLPLLEKLADPAPLVVSSCEASLQCICTHCGYDGSLTKLIGENVDYVIDGICRQLRLIDEHPRAPQLFAAVLQNAGVAPELLPMLAEPAQRALKGLSIVARHKAPGNVVPYIAAMLEIAQGSQRVVQEALQQVQPIADRVEKEYDTLNQQPFQPSTDDDGDDEHPTSIEEIKQYLLAEEERRDVDGTFDHRKVPLLQAEREAVRLACRRAAAAASLAQSTADCAGSLAASSSVAVAVQALGVCMASLRALDLATKVAELDENIIQALAKTSLEQGGDVEPTESPITRVLPSVHLFWMPLMAALKDWRVAVVETALKSLFELIELAGDFLTKRFQKEAWPVLQHLLTSGPKEDTRRTLLLPGDDDSKAPALIQRTRLAVLHCLERLSGSTQTKDNILIPCASETLIKILECMDDEEDTVLKEAATKAFMAVARVDPDAAWAHLVAVLHALPPAGPALLHERWPTGDVGVKCMQQHLPKKLRIKRSTTKVAAMLDAIQMYADIPWHSAVEAMLQV